MGIVEEEADETMYWIDLSIDAGLLKRNRVQSILKETDEILAITVSSINTPRSSRRV
jgi:four helix bundle protein